MRNIRESKLQAAAYLKELKKNKQIPLIAKDLNCDVSWFYKVAKGLIKPSYERSLMVLDHKKQNSISSKAA